MGFTEEHETSTIESYFQQVPRGVGSSTVSLGCCCNERNFWEMSIELHTSLRRLSQQVDLSHATSQKTVKIDQITKENDLLSLVGLVNEQRSSGFILLQWWSMVSFPGIPMWIHKMCGCGVQKIKFFYQESQVHPKKIGAWVAISRRRLTTPVFFDVFVTAVRSEEFIIDKMCVYFIKTCRWVFENMNRQVTYVDVQDLQQS